MKIEFIKGFVSTTYGNVYFGKKIEVAKREAKTLIKDGYAKEALSEEDETKLDTENAKKEGKAITEAEEAKVEADAEAKKKAKK